MEICNNATCLKEVPYTFNGLCYYCSEKEYETKANRIKKVYERFKHLDVILSDIVSMNEDNDPIHATCYELWKAIKNEIQS